MILHSISLAQEVNQKVSELGLNFKCNSSLGIRYKFGKKPIVRVSLTSVSGKIIKDKDGTSTSKSFEAGLNFGIEKRKQLSDNLFFYFGPEIITSINDRATEYYYSEGSNSDLTISSGFGLVLGLLLNMNDKISISSEIIPSICYTYNKTIFSGYVYDKDIDTGFNYGLISPEANLTLSYRFGKKN